MEYGERGEERTRLFNDPPQIIRIFPQIDSNQEMNRISLIITFPQNQLNPFLREREREKREHTGLKRSGRGTVLNLSDSVKSR